MKLRHLAALVGGMLAVAGAGLVIKSFSPQRFASVDTDQYERVESAQGTVVRNSSSYPNIDVTFLRCGSVTISESFAVRGGSLFKPRVISHSAVLVHHPQGTFLYDTGLCTDIDLFLLDQKWFFRQTRGCYILEQPIGCHLERLGMTASDLDFILLSHLHWDHVSGIPDLPHVPLRVNRVEYDAARQGGFAQDDGLVPRLMGNNPIQLFDCAGPMYEGFRSSYDLFGDGSVVLVPLPGHTAGQMGMFINRANSPQRLFLIADAAWVSDNYQLPATMHPFLWSLVTRDDATARQTLLDLYHFSRQHPEIPIVAMHDAQMQEAITRVEQSLSMQTYLSSNAKKYERNA